MGAGMSEPTVLPIASTLVGKFDQVAHDALIDKFVAQIGSVESAYINSSNVAGEKPAWSVRVDVPINLTTYIALTKTFRDKGWYLTMKDKHLVICAR